MFLIISFNVYTIPCRLWADVVWQVKYDKRTFNCLHKSRLYHNYLITQGIQSRLVVGYYKSIVDFRHSWVEYFEKGSWYLVDLTRHCKYWGFKVEQWGKDYKPVEYYYDVIETWEVE